MVIGYTRDLPAKDGDLGATSVNPTEDSEQRRIADQVTRDRLTTHPGPTPYEDLVGYDNNQSGTRGG